MGCTEADGSEERVWLGILNRIIICFDCAWKNIVSAGSGRKRIRRKESGSQASAGTASGAVSHSILLFFGVLVCFWGNYLNHGGVI